MLLKSVPEVVFMLINVILVGRETYERKKGQERGGRGREERKEGRKG